MLKRFWISVVLAIAVLLLVGTPATATQKTPTLTSYYETDTIDQYAYTTPSLTALGVDTCVVTIALPRDLKYALICSVPTWRILVGGHTATANVDSMNCELWLGRTGMTHRNTAMTGVLNNKQKAFDVTLYPLPTFRTMTLYITNGDSTAAAFDVNVGVLKGYLP